ncbi:uncharacterized protein LOC141620883 [Silene latifolia]|uniref:uncharacterized protein LOC141620883 n=1 Tax=Silene latifolia TaxID=37657 RepID=UPI003D780990
MESEYTGVLHMSMGPFTNSDDIVSVELPGGWIKAKVGFEIYCRGCCKKVVRYVDLTVTPMDVQYRCPTQRCTDKVRFASITVNRIHPDHVFQQTELSNSRYFMLFTVPVLDVTVRIRGMAVYSDTRINNTWRIRTKKNGVIEQAKFGKRFGRHVYATIHRTVVYVCL